MSSLQDNLERLGDINSIVASAAAQQAAAIIDDAQTLVPVRTGQLRASGYANSNGDFGFSAGYASLIEANDGYFGEAIQRAEPIALPAVWDEVVKNAVR